MSVPDDMPLHIAFLLTQSLESPGGLGRFGPLARSLAKLGHTVEIYALHPNFTPHISLPFNSGGVRVQYVAPMHVKKHGNQKTYYTAGGLLKASALATWKLLGAASHTRADILQVCKPQPMNGLAGLIGARLGKKRLFVDCDDYEAAINLFSAGWQRQVVAFFERQIPRRAAAVTTHTKFMASKLIEWGVPEEKIHNLPNGVDLERFKAPQPHDISMLKAKLGLDGKRVIGYVGSLSLSGHPIDLLFKAFIKVKQSLASGELVLLIVGGGENFETLKDLARSLGISEQVVFTGRIPPDQVTLYYRLLDVSVDPVEDNPVACARFPLKLVESWACGIPFVTGDVGDRRLLLGNPPAGVLCRPGDIDSLAQSVLEILQNPNLAEQTRSLGLEQAKRYSWDRLAKVLEGIYYSVVV